MWIHPLLTVPRASLPRQIYIYNDAGGGPGMRRPRFVALASLGRTGIGPWASNEKQDRNKEGDPIKYKT